MPPRPPHSRHNPLLRRAASTGQSRGNGCWGAACAPGVQRLRGAGSWGWAPPPPAPPTPHPPPPLAGRRPQDAPVAVSGTSPSALWSRPTPVQQSGLLPPSPACVGLRGRPPPAVPGGPAGVCGAGAPSTRSAFRGRPCQDRQGCRAGATGPLPATGDRGGENSAWAALPPRPGPSPSAEPLVREEATPTRPHPPVPAHPETACTAAGCATEGEQSPRVSPVLTRGPCPWPGPPARGPSLSPGPASGATDTHTPTSLLARVLSKVRGDLRLVLQADHDFLRGDADTETLTEPTRAGKASGSLTGPSLQVRGDCGVW